MLVCVLIGSNLISLGHDADYLAGKSVGSKQSRDNVTVDDVLKLSQVQGGLQVCLEIWRLFVSMCVFEVGVRGRVFGMES